MTIHNELLERVITYYCEIHEGNTDAYDHVSMLRNCTLEQLWCLYTHYVEQSQNFKVIHNNEYLSIMHGGMYIGIELDGYAHT